MSILLSLLVAGSLAGLIAGLLGVGGGIVTVPVLYQVFTLLDMPPELRMHSALATSLALIIPTSLRSVYGHYQQGAVDRDFLQAWAGWIVVGALLGAALASQLSAGLLRGFFGIVALLIATMMLTTREGWGSGLRAPTTWLRPLFASLVGCVSTLMGIGGGIFGVPLLVLYGAPMTRAVGTAAGFGLLISVPGCLGAIIAGWGLPGLPQASLGYVNLAALLCMAPMTWLTTPLGVALAHSLKPRRLRSAFAIFLLLVAIRMLWT